MFNFNTDKRRETTSNGSNPKEQLHDCLADGFAKLPNFQAPLSICHDKPESIKNKFGISLIQLESNNG